MSNENKNNGVYIEKNRMPKDKEIFEILNIFKKDFMPTEDGARCYCERSLSTSLNYIVAMEKSIKELKWTVRTKELLFKLFQICLDAFPHKTSKSVLMCSCRSFTMTNTEYRTTFDLKDRKTATKQFRAQALELSKLQIYFKNKKSEIYDNVFARVEIEEKQITFTFNIDFMEYILSSAWMVIDTVIYKLGISETNHKHAFNIYAYLSFIDNSGKNAIKVENIIEHLDISQSKNFKRNIYDVILNDLNFLQENKVIKQWSFRNEMTTINQKNFFENIIDFQL